MFFQELKEEIHQLEIGMREIHGALKGQNCKTIESSILYMQNVLPY